MSDAVHPDALSGFPVVLSLPVQWGDQDAFGHVNNTVHLRWFESARIAYLERCGWGRLMSGDGLGPILARIRCQYRRPLVYPDRVAVGVRVASAGRSSMTMEHVIYSESLRAIAAEGESLIVFFDYRANRPRRMPGELRAALEQVEGRRLADRR